MRGWSRLLGFSALLIVVGLVPLTVGWSHMPDPAATHWGIGGDPDGRLPLALAPLLMAGIVAVGLLTTSLFRLEGKPTAEAYAMVGLLGGLGAALMTSLVYLNWDVTDWTLARPFTLVHFAGVLVGAALGVALGYGLGRRWHPPPVFDPGRPPVSIEVLPGERVSWVGSCSVTWPLVLVGGVSILFFWVGGWFLLVGALFVALALLFGRLYVTVNDQGMTVRLGGGIPARRIRLDKIKTIRPIDLEPAKWGGWGWRVVPGASAIVLRRGDAIEVTFESDRRFAVTVDDAATGAALANGLLLRRARET